MNTGIVVQDKNSYCKEDVFSLEMLSSIIFCVSISLKTVAQR